jgi:threonylcarbamoyladenosine tRNA methylthiotransferase MtaB
LHLPLQSASDAVLKKMRRQYLFRRYDSIVKRLFAANPRLSLGSDILVGFPGEDRVAFEETKSYVTSAPFAYCHVFPFSPRPETPAASYPASAQNGEITERASKIREIARKKNLDYRRQFKGELLQALLLQGTQEALTGNYIRVQVNDPQTRSGFVQIRIHSVEGDCTRGSIVH